ncbi:hypothetical protein GCM10010449_47450 [Streptomyces rectiviolaceus]|uniref:Uncharacterized protein n=1 Tax=Streptomyces rectiviolaceus TaxID=332591 RepID=A0ABP6MMX6_9ACTN
MFHQSTASPPAPSRERLLTLADYGWDTERERSFAPSRAEGLVPPAVPLKQISRQVRALKQSPHFKA